MVIGRKCCDRDSVNDMKAFMTFILHHFKGCYSDNGSWLEVRGVDGRNYCLSSKIFNVQIMFLNASHVNIFVILAIKE